MENQTTGNNMLQPENVTQAAHQVDTAARKRKANTLCGISLVLFVTAVLSITGAYLSFALLEYEQGNNIFKIATSVSSVAYEASWVFVIVARAKFRENKFAKVLLKVYIAIAITVAVVAIAFIAYCFYTCATCHMPG